ncbi:MAG: hypothetical protein H0V17_02350 [Deltaproteobacteria bacterium]|nr:hypothetical protein [Deltaproteobacteria bacterium]
MLKKLLVVLVVVSGCGEDEFQPLPDAPVFLDAAPDAPACPPVSGAGTTHGGTVAAPETWTAADSPHIVPFDTSITAALTIESCAVVRIGGGKQITVRSGGSIVAQGVAGLPVRIEANDAAAWVNIRTLNGGTVSFTHTTIDGGGDPLNGDPQVSGALDIAGPTAVVAGVIHADHLTITGSKSCGITLHDGGGFDASSTDLVISGSTVSPISSFARSLGTIPPGTYTGNTVDEIIIGNGAIAESMTIRARGVPYRVGTQANATIDVAAVTGVATLTIEAGVTMRFAAGATLRIEPATGTLAARGALIAVGTPAAPIVMTSAAATPAAGDWFGVWFGGLVDPTTRLDHVQVSFAGKASATGSDSCPYPNTTINDAAIRLLGAAPAAVFVTNTEVISSASHGIDRGFRSDTKPSYLPTNTITGFVGCRETHPRDVNGTCPLPVPCP